MIDFSRVTSLEALMFADTGPFCGMDGKSVVRKERRVELFGIIQASGGLLERSVWSNDVEGGKG